MLLRGFFPGGQYGTKKLDCTSNDRGYTEQICFLAGERPEALLLQKGSAIHDLFLFTYPPGHRFPAWSEVCCGDARDRDLVPRASLGLDPRACFHRVG